MGIKELGELLANGINLAEKEDGIEPATINTYFIPLIYRFKNRTTRIKVESRDIGDAFILGHPINAVLGTSELGAGTQGSYSTIETLYDVQSIVDNGRLEIREFLNKEGTGNVAGAYPNKLLIGSSNTTFQTSDAIMVSSLGVAEDVTDSTSAKKATYVCIIRSTDKAIVDSKTIKEVGLSAGGRTRIRVDTTLGGQEANITLNTDA